MSQIQYPFSRTYLDSGGSAIRELARFAEDPEVISFAAGYPAIDSFDYAGLQEASEAAWREDPRNCMQYQSSEGSEPLAQELLKISRQRGIEAAREELLVTTGSQQAFDFLIRSYIEPGDTVLVEEPTYPGAVAALRLAGADIVGVKGDAQGIQPQDARRVVDELAARGVRPKFLYVVADFANPTGATLSRERRVALAELAVEKNFLLVEDDPYGLLRFRGERVEPIRSLADEIQGGRDWLVYMSTLSKSLTPGVRIGWIIAPAAVTRRCVKAKQVSDLCSSPWAQAIATAYLRSGRFDSHLPKTVEVYRQRGQHLAARLRAVFGNELAFSEPDGGMFIWASFNMDVDMHKLLRNAKANKVLFVPGSACFHDGRQTPTLRISYSEATEEKVVEGVARLHRAYRATVGEARPD